MARVGVLLAFLLLGVVAGDLLAAVSHGLDPGLTIVSGAASGLIAGIVVNELRDRGRSHSI